jgi:hypothetical protein
VAARLRIPDASSATVRDGDARSFKWAIAAELLRRQGLTRDEIGQVIGKGSTWTKDALREINLRMQHPAFRRHVEAMQDVYDELARFIWEMRNEDD